MNRRRFLQAAASAAAAVTLSKGAALGQDSHSQRLEADEGKLLNSTDIDLGGASLICEFERAGVGWKVYEEIAERDGNIIFVNASKEFLTIRKPVEAAFNERGPEFLGLNPATVFNSNRDLLAEKLLRNGEPDPEEVKSAIPPLAGCALTDTSIPEFIWNTFVGTVECQEPCPIYPRGNSQSYLTEQLDHGLAQLDPAHRFEGMLGGWMPGARKVFPYGEDGYYEVIVFGDTVVKKPHIVDTWFRTSFYSAGKRVKVIYGNSYPKFGRWRREPAPQMFYLRMLEFALYWKNATSGISSVEVPDAWGDMSRHAFTKELMVRPGGIYPKYGAVDQMYENPSCDGFQDTFTTSLYANLEWRRFDMANAVFDNYYTEFVGSDGMIDMRGPEVGQYGQTLSLIARLFRYTGDSRLLVKHRMKIEATAQVLIDLHNESLKLDSANPGHGLIHGWSESDSCLWPDPAVYWQPYFSNSAQAARGLGDLSAVWSSLHVPGAEESANLWAQHSSELKSATLQSIRSNIRHNTKPPYIGPLPGMTETFQQAQSSKRNVQQWPHRMYSELLQADIIPDDLGNLVIDCLRNNGGTTAGVVADIWPIGPKGRKILGFISYGYAQMLLRLDRIDEFLLFLYSHRFHDHTRGSWTAAETRYLADPTVLFCIPAQQTIPLLVRWMLLMEHSDVKRLYVARGIPSNWLVSGHHVGLHHAPTKWGQVSFDLYRDGDQIRGTLDIESGQPEEVHVRMRVPPGKRLKAAARVNGRSVPLTGRNADTIIIRPNSPSHNEVIAELA